MKKVFYSWRQIEGAVIDIARQLQKDQWRPDYVVGITRGGAIPAVLLSQYLGVPMRSLEVSLRDGGECVSDCGMAEDAFGYVLREDREFSEGDNSDINNRKNILIIDDINDTGATIAWIKKDWQSSCLPNDPSWAHIWGNNVRVAVLTNNLASKEDIQYSAWEVNKAEDDCWLVYPWEEFWKND
jgi:hypoxanthine phosphoribosyltransferase